MDKMKTILTIEDDKDILFLLEYNIQKAGYRVISAADGREGLEKALSGEADLILLDIMLPFVDGYEICRRVRETMTTPIIMLTARESESDKVMGLEIGADDYMTKPFSIRELLARIKANIRRYSYEIPEESTLSAENRQEDGSNQLRVGDLVIDTGRYLVLRGGEELELTKIQYELLTFLAENAGTVYSREELMQKVWGYDGFYGDARTVDTTVSRLRKKLEKNPAEPEYILAKRGAGYYIPPSIK